MNRRQRKEKAKRKRENEKTPPKTPSQTIGVQINDPNARIYYEGLDASSDLLFTGDEAAFIGGENLSHTPGRGNYFHADVLVLGSDPRIGTSDMPRPDESGHFRPEDFPEEKEDGTGSD